MATIQRLIRRAISKDNDKGVRNTEPVQATLRPDPTLNPLATTAPLKSSSVHPGDTVSQPNAIPRNILAFRLITKMLHRIPQTQPFVSMDNLGDNNEWMSEDRREVRVSDAFAHLAIAEHGTVAIATNRCSLEGPPNLNIVACTTLPSVSEGSMKPTPNVGLLDKIWNIMLAKNARYDDPVSLYPVIVIPAEPNDFGNFQSLNDYMKNLEENWQEPALPSHLWILGRLLESRSDAPEDQLARLYIYTLSMCCRKMNHRLQSQSSRHYLQSLEQVKDFAFNPQPTNKTPPKKTLRDSRRERQEFHNDRRLLEDIIVLNGTSSDGIPINIPHLLLAADNMASDSKKESFELYDSTTCMEFHQLLVKLLVGFRDTVASLSAQSNRAIKGSWINKTTFKQDLTKGRVYGYALMRIARGRAFRMHMENIEHLLSDYTPDTEAPEGEREGEDVDEELDKKGSLSKSYGAWLRLMVIHFDAIEILVSFVNGVGSSYEAISIKILVPPTTSHEVLPWSELFTDPNLFPKSDVLNPNLITQSNAEIKEFLQVAIENARFASESYNQAKKAQTSWNSSQFLATRDALSKLTKIISSPPTPPQPDSEAVQRVKARALQSLKDLQSRVNQFISLLKKEKHSANFNQDDNLKVMQLIEEGFKEICANYCEPPAIDKFYLDFDKENSFAGTLHCEAYLAALLDNFIKHFEIDGTRVDKQILQELKGYGRVIGVSKRCCPACSNFLHFISENSDQQPFLVRGSHSNVTACTLPPWTPSHIVDKMITLFGNRLRKDLIALMPVDRSTPFRSRPASAGSQTLSLDSSEGHKSKQKFTSLETDIVLR